MIVESFGILPPVSGVPTQVVGHSICVLGPCGPQCSPLFFTTPVVLSRVSKHALSVDLLSVSEVGDGACLFRCLVMAQQSSAGVPSTGQHTAST